MNLRRPLCGLLLFLHSSAGLVGRGVDRSRYLSMRASKRSLLDEGNWSGRSYKKGMRSVLGTNGLVPKTDRQVEYLQHLTNSSVSIVVGVGAAGTGKTLFACHTAVQSLREGSVDRIVLTRPMVSVDDEEMGFLPGNIVKKMDPWTRPMFDIFLEYFSKTELDSMVGRGVIEISPLAYMRGRTFKRAFIIADEMQNSSPNQMMMLVTRLGEDSKMVITGDPNQSDFGSGGNGLVDLLGRLRGGALDEVGVVEFESRDVQRSVIVSKMLDVYRPRYSIRKSSDFSAEIAPMAFGSTTSNDDAAMIPLSQWKKSI